MSRNLAIGDRVWVPHVEEAWVVGHVTNLSTTTVQVATDQGKLELSLKSSPPLETCGSHLEDDIDNLVDLDELSEGAILHHVRKRFHRKSIYTLVGPILVAVNPFERLPIYEQIDIRKAYAHVNVYPHIFVSATIAYAQLRDNKKSQSVLISGESGAGKTETTKKVLQFLASVASPTNQSMESNSSETGVQERIMESNPLLEAMGNAKTLRNNNSSRFGKYMRIEFDAKCRIQGCSIVNYLLEKSRVVFQSAMERNYHVFYQLCAGASQLPFASLLGVGKPSDYRYLNKSGCIGIDGVNDGAEFSDIIKAMNTLQFSLDRQESVFRIITAVLHLGNILFLKSESNADDSKIDVSTRNNLDTAAKLLGLDPVALSVALTEKTMTVGREVVTVLFNPSQAADNRDTLAKSLYGLLFDWIIGYVNDTLRDSCDPSTSHSIGILDIFGFEVFEVNSFEQLCINYANEKLQLHFNSVVFGQEMEMYEAEGIPLTHIEFVDNSLCVQLVENRKLGLISLLEEECSLGNGKDISYVNKIEKAFGVGRKDMNPHFSKNKIKPAFFSVKHFAGNVEYFVDGWLDKNRDTLSQTLNQTMSESALDLVLTLFTSTSFSEPAKGSTGATKRTLGGQFRSQLTDLIASVQSTEPHFVRCIKPNSTKQRSIMEGSLVLDQMRYSGLFEAIRIRKSGYAYRSSHEVFCNSYKILADDVSSLLTTGEILPHEACKLILDQCVAAGVLPPGVSHAGATKVFLKANQHRTLLERYKRVRVEKYAVVIQNAYRFHRAYIQLNHAKFQRRQEELKVQREMEHKHAMCVLIQAIVRGMQARMLVQSMGELVALRHALRNRNIVEVTKILGRLEAEQDMNTEGKLSCIFQAEITAAKAMIKLMEVQNIFIQDLETDLLEKNMEGLHETLKRAEMLQLSSHPTVLNAYEEIKSCLRKRSIMKSMLKFLDESDEFDKDPSALLTEAIDLGVDPAFIEKVRRANDSAGPRLRAREGIRKAIETVDEAGILASLVEVETLQRFHPKFLRAESIVGKIMLKMIRFDRHLTSNSHISSLGESKNGHEGIEGPRLTPTVLGLCEVICSSSGTDEVAESATKKLQLMTRSNEAYEEIIRCFKWSKVLCTWKHSQKVTSKTKHFSKKTTRELPEAPFFGLDVAEARRNQYLNRMLTPTPINHELSTNENSDEVGEGGFCEKPMITEVDDENVSSAVKNELLQLDKLSRLHDSFNRFGAPSYVQESDDVSVGMKTITSYAATESNIAKGSPTGSTPKVSTTRISTLSLAAAIKPKAKTEFVSLSIQMEKKLIASRGAKAKQKRRHELLVKHIKATRANEIQKAFR